MTRLPVLAFSTLLALFLFPLPSRAAEPLRVVAVKPVAAPAAAVHPYDVCEFAITLGGGSAPYANPYDPGEIAVDAVVTGGVAGQKSGARLAVPAFWNVPYARGTADANGGIQMVAVPGASAGWRLRVAFPSAGMWRVAVHARDHSGVTAEDASAVVTVLPAPKEDVNPGFVRRAPANDRYFAFDSGASYFPIGENVCWAGGRRGLADFDDWFSALGKAGGNWARVWLAHEPIESQATGLGRYDARNAAYYDEVLRDAHRFGIRCLLSLGTYGELATGGYFHEGIWPASPYNAANGGPAATPESFFTDPRAIALYQRRLRYLIARYAAFTDVAFWEFWNEQAGPAPWFKTMAVYLKTNDPYRHLVTNSYSTTGTADVWEIPEIDMTQTHRYGDTGSIPDIAPVVAADARAHDHYAKPHMVGEFGISWRGGDETFDPRGIGTNLHNGLWSSMLSGDAGGAAIWWWDSYVAPKNLYHAFTAPARFARTVDWAHRDFQSLALESPLAGGSQPPTLRDLALQPQTAWGEKPGAPVVIGRDGRTTGGAIVGFLYGPSKPELAAPFTLVVDLPAPSSLVLHVLTVSDSSNLHVVVDGGTGTDFPLVAAPGHGQDYESTKQFPEYNNIYQALFNRDRTVSLPAGRHTITLTNTAGDWLSLGAITLKNALSSRYTTLTPLALQDRATGETLVYLHDPEANWTTINRDGKMPPVYAAGQVRLRLPVSHAGRYTAQWWDTQTGEVIASRPVAVAKAHGEVTLDVPAFRGDVALHLKSEK